MMYDVLVKQTNGQFTATVLGLPDCTVEATTRTEAIQQAQTAAANFIATGELVQIEVNSPNRPKSLKDFVGMWADDEMFDEFVASMDAYRRDVDSDPNQP